MKKEIRRIIELNRELGGSMWQEYTQEELLQIYDGNLPSWAPK